MLDWQQLAASGGPTDVECARLRSSLPVEAVADALRLAHVLQWQRRIGDVEDLFAAAIASAERLATGAPDGSDAWLKATRLTAFGYQHLGKSRFDEGRYDEALVLLERALMIRNAGDAPDDQNASSRQGVAAAQRRLRPDPSSLAEAR